LVLVEDYPYGIHSSSLTQVAEAGGIVRAVFAAAGSQIIAVPISTWKAMTIKNQPKATGRDKLRYTALVEKKYGRPFSSTDEADAFLMYMAMRRVWTERKGKATDTVRRLRRELVSALTNAEVSDAEADVALAASLDS
jgi:hypothetical protein